MARRTRTKKASGGVKTNLSGPTTPEQPQVVALARDPKTGDPEEPKTMAAMALSGPTSPEQPQ